MSASALANVVGQALSLTQLGSAVWRTMEEAEEALRSFSAAQGWSLSIRKSAKHTYKLRVGEGEERLGEVELHKVWLCSRAHQRQANVPHFCTEESDAAAGMVTSSAAAGTEPVMLESHSCDAINSSGHLTAPCAERPRLAASSKTGCPVAIRVVMLRKGAPENGSFWTEVDTPCAGYKLSTATKLLLPCQHNHCSLLSERPLTESIAGMPDAAREEVKQLVVANFPSYRIRNYICSKHNLPPLVPAVWTSLIRAIKTELGIHDAGQDLQTLIARLTKERNERGAVFDMTVDGDLTVTAIFFMSRAMVASFHRCAQFVVMDSTCKTNRFGMSLFLVCGVDEHMHIALYATALMKDETQPAFEYVLRQLRRAVGTEAWIRMTCAATDGCAAMTAALAKEASHTMQQRCVWHLQQNIIKHTGGSSHQHVIRAWYACVYAKSLVDFDARWAELLRVQMSEKCIEYLTKYIHPLRAKWAVYSTGQLTNFGSHSTQLVESLNRLLKMWDVNDKTSLSRAVERICIVKDEEETRRQITAMKDHAMRSLIAGPAGHIQAHDAYKVKVRKVLTGAAAVLCEEQYDLFAQYKAVLHPQSSAAAYGLFALGTQVYIVTHKAPETSTSEHQVHVSPHLIYCPCGFFTAYLLPCRHVLAANGAAFTDVFQAGQYHPRWWLLYTEALQRDLLSKQFWISVGKEVTSEGLKRVRYEEAKNSEAEGEHAEEKGEWATAAASSAAASAGASAGALELLLPAPMYPVSPLELHPALLSPQQLYHMIEGECASLRQLACANPAKLSGLVWTELHQAKQRITQFIDREQRTQQQLNISAAASATGGLTSEGIPLASLLAPVPLTLTKPGRPSSKRSRAAVEGVAARKVRAMMPVQARGGEDGGAQAGMEQTARSISYGATQSLLLASPAAIMSAAAAASDAAGAASVVAGGRGRAAGVVDVGSSRTAAVLGDAASSLRSGGGYAGVAAAVGSAVGAAATVVRVSGKGRVLVRRAPFE
jgi:hypothetical protein